MAQHHSRTARRTAAIVGVVAAIGVCLTGGGVYAALNARAFNATPENVTSGTLQLTMGSNAATFAQDVTNLAPGDTVTRYVDLVNSGTLAGKNLSVQVTDANATRLVSDATSGLRATISECATAWVAGACATTPLDRIATLPVASLSAPNVISTDTLTPGATRYLRVVLTLPDRVETVDNGVQSATTLQGLSARLTWEFSETQRAATSS